MNCKRCGVDLPFVAGRKHTCAGPVMNLHERLNIQNEALEKLTDYIEAMEKRIDERLAHHDHMGGVYQTRILRLEKENGECVCLQPSCVCPSFVEAVE